jgi:hypothetical protein
VFGAEPTWAEGVAQFGALSGSAVREVAAADVAGTAPATTQATNAARRSVIVERRKVSSLPSYGKGLVLPETPPGGRS